MHSWPHVDAAGNEEIVDMLVTYTALTRGHHYIYARALARARCLRRFVSGFSRFSPRAPLPEIGDKMLRADHLQNIYLAAVRLRFPSSVSEELIFRSKCWLDLLSKKDALRSDLFLFYSGTGLSTLRAMKSTPVVGVVEAVNSHVLVQQQILREEHERLRLPLQGFHPGDMERRVREYDLADAIICPSTFSAQSFIDQGFPADRVRVVPFGVEAGSSGAPLEKPRDSFRVLFVGQINIRKGLRYLFEAFNQFRHPKKELWVVGPKAEPTGIDDIAPPDGAKFLGVLKGDDLSHAYRSCHVLVLPTLEEGMALVLGEALSHGLPVIATVNSGGTDLFEDGSTGFLVPIRSPQAITEKLQLLADEPSRVEALSVRAAAHDNGLRTWENTTQKLVQTLGDFAQQPRRN